jgi:prevent-host-death family protein
MYPTAGADKITDVTTLRNELPTVIDQVQEGHSVLVQRTGKPVMVCLSVDQFREYQELRASAQTE